MASWIGLQALHAHSSALLRTMDLTTLSPRFPAIAAMLQIPWFIVLSIARVRLGGTSARPLVKLVDLLVPLPAFVGLFVAVVLLWQLGGRGGTWLWGGALGCALLSAGFAWVLLNNEGRGFEARMYS